MNSTRPDFVKLRFEIEATPDDYFRPMFSNEPMIVGAIVSYICGYGGIFILGVVIWFERSGLAGTFRTLLNILTTFILEQAILFQVICGSIDVARLVIGPLNSAICTFGVVMKNLISMNIFMIGCLMTITKYGYICIYKAPVFDDNFLATLIHISVYFLSTLAIFVKFYGPGAPVLIELICIGEYNPSWKSAQKPFKIDAWIGANCFATHATLTILIFKSKYKMKKNAVSPQPQQPAHYQQNVDLGTILYNAIISISVILQATVVSLAASIDPEETGNMKATILYFMTYYYNPPLTLIMIGCIFVMKKKKIRDCVMNVLRGSNI